MLYLWSDQHFFVIDRKSLKPSIFVYLPEQRSTSSFHVYSAPLFTSLALILRFKQEPQLKHCDDWLLITINLPAADLLRSACRHTSNQYLWNPLEFSRNPQKSRTRRHHPRAPVVVKCILQWINRTNTIHLPHTQQQQHYSLLPQSDKSYTNSHYSWIRHGLEFVEFALGMLVVSYAPRPSLYVVLCGIQE